MPENLVLRVDGVRMTAWLTWDKRQFMKPTTEDLHECYDPNQRLKRTDKRQTGVELNGLRPWGRSGMVTLRY